MYILHRSRGPIREGDRVYMRVCVCVGSCLCEQRQRYWPCKGPRSNSETVNGRRKDAGNGVTRKLIRNKSEVTRNSHYILFLESSLVQVPKRSLQPDR